MLKQDKFDSPVYKVKTKKLDEKHLFLKRYSSTNNIQIFTKNFNNLNENNTLFSFEKN